MKSSITLLLTLILTSGCESLWIVSSADGHVVDARSHKPIALAKVTRVCDRAPAETQTDADGYFRFHGKRIFELPIGDTIAAAAYYRVDAIGYGSWESRNNQTNIISVGWASQKDIRHHFGEIQLTPKIASFTPDFHAFGFEDANDAKARFDSYKQVFLVRILEDYWEDRGPHKFALHHYKATVAKCYKGKWNVGETLTFTSALDGRAPNATNALAGNDMLLLSDKRAKKELTFDTGDYFVADTNLQLILQSVFKR